MSNGIISALYELVEYICKPDEKVLFLTPSYAYFKYAADFSKRGYVYSDLIYENGKYSIDFENFERKAAYEKDSVWLEELRAYLDENFRFTGEYLKVQLPKAGYRISQATYLACPKAVLAEGVRTALCGIYRSRKNYVAEDRKIDNQTHNRGRLEKYQSDLGRLS